MFPLKKLARKGLSHCHNFAQMACLQWIPQPSGQQYGKRFFVMISSLHWQFYFPSIMPDAVNARHKQINHVHHRDDDGNDDDNDDGNDDEISPNLAWCHTYQLAFPKPLTRPFVLKYVKLLGFANQASLPHSRLPGESHMSEHPLFSPVVSQWLCNQMQSA